MDRDEKYMAMFDEWLRAQKEKEAAASAAPEGAGPAGQQAYTQPWAPAESAHMQQPGQRPAHEGGAQPAYGAGVQPGQYAPVPPQRPQQEPPKKGGAGKIIGIIAALVGCILVAVVISVCILYPIASADNGVQPGGSIEQPMPSGGQPGGPEQKPGEAPDPPVPSVETILPETAPEFDGVAPNITSAANPVPEIAQQVAPGVVGVTVHLNVDGQDRAVARGTGFVVSSDGYIVSNNHVVEGGNKFIITMQDGTEHEAKLVGTDASMDVAVLKVEATGLKALAIGNSASTQVGEMAVAIGNPAGAGENLTGTVTVGYVSAVDRELLFNGSRQKFIQTDAAINPGNSGGPLVNSRGEVIGIVTLKTLVSTLDSSTGSPINAEGIGFAVPISVAMTSINQILESGSIIKPGIGVYYSYVDPETAKENDIPAGALIRSLMDGSPAGEAGIQEGDVIIEADGQDCGSQNSIAEIIAKKQVGDKLECKVWRDGKTITATITIQDMNQMR